MHSKTQTPVTVLPPTGLRLWKYLLLALLTLPIPGLALPPLAHVQQLAVGEAHACVLTTSGEVRCWGSNNFGQLGDDSRTNRYLPVQVTGLASGVSAISLGYRHSCALLDEGTVKCWGKNLLSQLGDGTSIERHTPVAVQGLTGVTAIAAGGDHNCALRGSSGVSCWGYNGDGQIGIGNTDTQPLPVNVPGAQYARAISAGYSNTCTITVTGTVQCWGVFDRICSTFGCGFDDRLVPTAIAGLSDVSQISAGQYFNCAVTTAGAVKCWGDNYHHQLGDLGTVNPDPLTLYDMAGLGSGVTSVSAGARHACAHLADGSARCWGDNGAGQLGDGSNADGLAPVVVAGLNNASRIAAGGSQTCARTASGGVDCWGSNSAGQLGDNEPWFRTHPVNVPDLGSGVKAIASGEFHSCAVTAAGALKCWGANGSGQLGTGGTLEHTTPAAVTGLGSGMAGVAAGSKHSCATSTGGAVKCWGSNEYGQLGDDSFDDHHTPTQVLGLDSGIADVDAGEDHTCARTSSGAAKCWGSDMAGQLGDNGPMPTQPAPVHVINLSANVTDISSGNEHSCAAAGGQVACWGSNDEAQIGDDSWETAWIPVTLAYPFEGTSAVGTGAEHSCAIVNGQALCWGDNGEGQCGTGFSSGNIAQPALVPGLADISAISAGQYHNCVIGAGGQAYCWGNNDQGQLGDGSTSKRTSPTPVVDLGSGVSRISAGGYHSCALRTGGIVQCWGDNRSGQLGIGRRNNRVPGAVLDDVDRIFHSGFEL